MHSASWWTATMAAGAAALGLWACNSPSWSGAPSAGALGGSTHQPERSSEAGPGRPGDPAVVSGDRVIVVGGGVAGLTAAYELQKRGISSTILEAADVFGGRVVTPRYGEGLFAEAGLQEIWASNPLAQIARELGLELEENEEQAYASVVLDGKLRPYLPGKTDDFFSTFLDANEKKALEAWFKQAETLHRAAEKEGLKNAEIQKLQDESFAAWIGRLKLPKRAADWVRLTIECELASSWESFSALVGLLEFGPFLGEGERNFRVRGGNQTLVDAMVKNHRGGKITNASVTRIERSYAPGPTKKSPPELRVRVTYLKQNRIHTLTADRVVVAVPFVRVHQIQFEPPLSADKWSGLMTLSRGQYTVVHLEIDKAAQRLWLVDGKNPLPILSDGTLGVIYGVKYPSPASSSRDIFSLLIHGAASNGWHMAPRETKVKQVLDKLDELWPGFSRHVHDRQVYFYHPAAVAVWPPGRSPIDERSDAIRRPEEGVYLVGDWTYNAHSDGAARTGQRAAKLIATELNAR